MAFRYGAFGAGGLENGDTFRIGSGCTNCGMELPAIGTCCCAIPGRATAEIRVSKVIAYTNLFCSVGLRMGELLQITKPPSCPWGQAETGRQVGLGPRVEEHVSRSSISREHIFLAQSRHCAPSWQKTTPPPHRPFGRRRSTADERGRDCCLRNNVRSGCAISRTSAKGGSLEPP